jgi:hypothetical protein
VNIAYNFNAPTGLHNLALSGLNTLIQKTLYEIENITRQVSYLSAYAPHPLAATRLSMALARVAKTLRGAEKTFPCFRTFRNCKIVGTLSIPAGLISKPPPLLPIFLAVFQGCFSQSNSP